MMNPKNRTPLWLRVAVRGLVGLGAIAATLFALAGHFDWPAAWFFVALFAL